MREWHPTASFPTLEASYPLAVTLTPWRSCTTEMTHAQPFSYYTEGAIVGQARDSVSKYRTCRKRESFPPDTRAFSACKCSDKEVKKSFVPCDAREAWYFSQKSKRYVDSSCQSTASEADAHCSSQTGSTLWYIFLLFRVGDSGSGKHNSVSFLETKKCLSTIKIEATTDFIHYVKGGWIFLFSRIFLFFSCVQWYIEKS